MQGPSRLAFMLSLRITFFCFFFFIGFIPNYMQFFKDDMDSLAYFYLYKLFPMHGMSSMISFNISKFNTRHHLLYEVLSDLHA